MANRYGPGSDRDERGPPRKWRRGDQWSEGDRGGRDGSGNGQDREGDRYGDRRRGGGGYGGQRNAGNDGRYGGNDGRYGVGGGGGGHGRYGSRDRYGGDRYGGDRYGGDRHGGERDRRGYELRGGGQDQGRRGNGGRPKGRGAPMRFGSKGRALAPGADLPGCTRVDAEGMVYETGDGTGVKYFQDRKRQYPFDGGRDALSLLRGLLSANEAILPLSQARIEATGQEAETLREGERLYAEKPTMKKHHGAKGTWSDAEYAHPGLQHVYLRLKSFQRFTESWALFERAALYGIFDDLLPGPEADETQTFTVASLGGGPGYELLAFEWFLRYWAEVRPAPGADAMRPRTDRAAWLAAQTFVVDAPKGSDEAGSAATETAADGPGAEAAAETGAAAEAVEKGNQAADEEKMVEAAKAAEGNAGTEAAEATGPAAPAAPVEVKDDSGPLKAPAKAVEGNGGTESAEATGPAAPGDGEDLNRPAEVPEEDIVECAVAPEAAHAGADSPTSRDKTDPGPTIDLISLDLQPSWEPFVRAMGFRFAAYDLHGTVTPLEAADRPRLDICMISNVLNYCTDEASADLLVGLFRSGTRCILLNERGAEQRMVEFVEARGVRVVRLLSQEGCGRDDRQMIFFPPAAEQADGADGDGGAAPDVGALEQKPAMDHADLVFPNVPYEERKFQR